MKMKLTLLMLTLCLLPGLSFAGYAHEQVTVGATTVKLTSSTYNSSVPGQTLDGAICTLETAQVRFCADGRDPATNTDCPLWDPVNAQSALQFTPSEVINLRFIETTATAGVVKCTYY